MKTTRPILRWLLSLIATAPTLTLAAAPALPDAVEADAIQLLRRSTDFVAGLKQIRFDTDASIDVVLPDGEKIQFDQHVVITAQRPDKLRVERFGELINQTFFYDGKTLTVDLPDQHYYAMAAAPNTIEGMLNFARDDLDIIAPGSDLMYKNSFERFTQNVTAAFVVGKAVVRGVRCDHLAFRNAEVDWQIWIEEGAKPFPRKFLVNSKKIPGSPQFVVVLSTWDTAPKITDATFRFVPPKNSQKIDFIRSAAFPAAKN